MINQQTLQVLGKERLPSRRSMTSCRESQKEPAMLTTLLSTRKTLNVGTWNTRTMFESGKTAQVAREMHNYHLVALAVKPWTGTPKGKEREGDHGTPQCRGSLKRKLKGLDTHGTEQLERIAQERGDRRIVIGGLCSGRSKGPKKLIK